MDDDGLIEIYSPIELHNMRYDLTGASYKTSTESVGNSAGCPEDTGCKGYELMENLDFDGDKDGRTWSGSGEEGFRLDEGDSRADYFPVDESGTGGWLPIGDEDNPFAAVFDGNGRSISNLAIRRSETFYVGLFGRTGAAAVIRNIGLVDNLADYSGFSNNNVYIGGLVGFQEGGSITASYATGAAAGGDGNNDYVGGLVGIQSGGSITASYATGPAAGGDGDDDVVGGLVGWQEKGGSITASYATGAAVGGDGDEDYVGGLVGALFVGSITASYATGAAVGGDGKDDSVGGLVGLLLRGLITASYATGPAAGGDGDDDVVGGLVGWLFVGSITASYATGAAVGGDGDGDSVGGLVGIQPVEGPITASYGFGGATGEIEGSAGSAKPPGVDTAARLTATNTGTFWDNAASNTLGAWDFGDDTQIPALNYADYDGDGDVFGCAPNPGFPANVCGTLLPGQDEASVSGPSSALEPGATVSLAGSPRYGRIGQFASFSWRQLAGPEVALSDAAAQAPTFTAPEVRDLLVFELTATAGDGREYRDRISLGVDVDRNDNGLIEIYSLLDLHYMRYNLKGTSYKTSSTTSVGNSFGCPDRVCEGYELMQDLDFDGDKDGSTWSGSGEEGFRLDEGDSQADYFPVDENGTGGWEPIGGEANPFVATFDGNGNTISNLAIRRDQTDVGLFGRTEAGAAIRNLGLIDNLADYIGTVSDVRVGGLAGHQDGGSIRASYATGAAAGGDGNLDSVGGLVGYQNAGSITASYATGAVAGGGGFDHVGGLVGSQDGGSITASYATGAAAGGGGNFDNVGGLVGTQYGGSSITASYATGAADGGDGSDDSVGGLVGYQEGSSITASYATGPADGGDGGSDYVGGLVGYQDVGSITASYGFGGATGEVAGSAGSAKPEGVETAFQLTAANAEASWHDAGSNTLGAWDFGTETQIPALQYADYDGDGDVFACADFPTGACPPPTLLPGQDEASVDVASSVLDPGETVSLVAGSPRYGRIDPFVSFSWWQLAGPEVALSDANARETTFTAPEVRDLLVFELTASASDGRRYRVRISLGVDVDRNDNGLIEIDSLLDLHYMRYNLKGTSYKTSSTTSVGNSFGCPATVCEGYELMQDLDFDGDKDGSTWSGSGEEGFRLDEGDSQADYFPVENGAGGWEPIGEEENPFVAVFDGNGNTISNLAISRDQTHVGLFGFTSGAAIRNLGLIDNLADYTGSSPFSTYIGGLAGRQSGGSITASYATGPAAGGDGDSNRVGGLVGWQSFGSITASYAAGAADGGGGGYDLVGGMVGLQISGTITASYAAGAADGGGGGYDFVGGLVGRQFDSSITASYATGTAAGGDGVNDYVGGLVGHQGGGMITASYATGAAAGGDGVNDFVGGLVGHQGGGMITASYATGAAAGGAGDRDYVGGLVGRQGGGLITASYGFGGATGEFYESRWDGSTKPSGVDTAAQLTAANAGLSWNDAGSNTLDAWDFGTETQIPALQYADYDGEDGSVFDCDPARSHFPAAAAADCGNGDDIFTLLPGQDEASVDVASSVLNLGEAVRLVAGPPRYGRIDQFASFGWQQLAGPEVALSDANARETTFTAPEVRDLLVFELTASAGDGRRYRDRISLGLDVDRNDNGLIEIDSLLDLHYMRYNLKGTSYKTSSTTSVGNSLGCPATVCKGYELMQELDFDGDDDDGGTWSVNDDGGYILDSDDHQADYFPVHEDGAGGWLPIGNRTNPFAAVFDGNGHSISNLAIRRGQIDIGLFAVIGEGAAIRNLGLIDNLAHYSGTANGGVNIGGLVGSNNGGSIAVSYATGAVAGGYGEGNSVGGLVGLNDGGSITASHATGAAAGGADGFGYVGGLVGYQKDGGSIRASYATGAVGGGDGDFDNVGGLVGYQDDSSITASYATGVAAGGDGDFDSVGGLVGLLLRGLITASYATGAAAGGYGEGNSVGGLVGWQGSGLITASYATGVAAGGGGSNDQVGGLVGRQERGSITASYATGAAAGGDGVEDSVGSLVGSPTVSSIIESYGFGATLTLGGEIEGDYGSPKPEGVSAASQLTAANAGSSWDDASSDTLDAWDFVTSMLPALKYADYDGAGGFFACSQFPADACGTLLPGQEDLSGGSSGGGGSLGLWALVILALPLLLGRRRRKTKNAIPARASSFLRKQESIPCRHSRKNQLSAATKVAGGPILMTGAPTLLIPRPPAAPSRPVAAGSGWGRLKPRPKAAFAALAALSSRPVSTEARTVAAAVLWVRGRWLFWRCAPARPAGTAAGPIRGSAQAF